MIYPTALQINHATRSIWIRMILTHAMTHDFHNEVSLSPNG